MQDYTSEKIYVAFEDRERRFVKAYRDFLYCPFLSLEEKIMFLALKSFADPSGRDDTLFPSIASLQEMLHIAHGTATKLVKGLSEKEVVKIRRRGQTKTNLYQLVDREEVWRAPDKETFHALAVETKEERLLRLSKEKGEETKIDDSDVPEENDALGLRDPERLFVQVYTDFLSSALLSPAEKGMFLMLKSYVNISSPDHGTVFPSYNTLALKTGKSRSGCKILVNSLCGKKVLEKRYRGTHASNLYIITDRQTVWCADTPEEAEAAAAEGRKQYEARALEQAIREEKKEAEKAKEKGQKESASASAASAAVPGETTDHEKTPTGKEKGTVRYDARSLWKMYGFNRKQEFCAFNEDEKKEIMACLSVISTTMNSRTEVYEIGDEKLDAAVVKEAFLRLDADRIIQAIDAYAQCGQKVKNPRKYLRTVLYEYATEVDALRQLNSENTDLMHMGQKPFSLSLDPARRMIENLKNSHGEKSENQNYHRENFNPLLSR